MEPQDDHEAGLISPKCLDDKTRRFADRLSISLSLEMAAIFLPLTGLCGFQVWRANMQKHQSIACSS